MGLWELLKNGDIPRSLSILRVPIKQLKFPSDKCVECNGTTHTFFEVPSDLALTYNWKMIAEPLGLFKFKLSVPIHPSCAANLKLRNRIKTIVFWTFMYMFILAPLFADAISKPNYLLLIAFLAPPFLILLTSAYFTRGNRKFKFIVDGEDIVFYLSDIGYAKEFADINSVGINIKGTSTNPYSDY